MMIYQYQVKLHYKFILTISFHEIASSDGKQFLMEFLLLYQGIHYILS